MGRTGERHDGHVVVAYGQFGYLERVDYGFRGGRRHDDRFP
jgi:hypothetical protein